MSSQLMQEQMPAAIEAFSAKVHAIPADGWDGPTPCTEWTVRDLVNHVTAEHLWAPHLLNGETIAEVGDRYDGDVLGDDPLATWNNAADASRQAWSNTQLRSRVHVSSGQIPVEEYGEQMYLDLVIHGWDLARGAGLDDKIDPAVADHIRQLLEPQIAAWSGMGVFADPVEGDFTDPGDRLIALVGRDPR